VADIDVDSGTSAAAAAVTLGARAMFVALDAGEESSWRALIVQTLASYGALHVVVNNAAYRVPVTIDETTLELWHANQRVTSQGVFLGTKLGAEAMHDGGSIVNFSAASARSLGCLSHSPTVPPRAPSGLCRALPPSITRVRSAAFG
jgi:NAD(P)-dependent dehydrogenase (short-subunit alcohol dehydrogenase family)